MKKNILVLLQLLSSVILQAQIGIGTQNPDPSSVLELKSTTRGFLPPRMSTVQRNAIVSPATGLLIYNSDKNCTEWYNGVLWYNGCGNQDSSGGTAVVSGYSAKTSSGSFTVGTQVSGVTQSITATVTVVGNYSISAMANGVNFTASGIFTVTGPQEIVLTASGIPLTSTTSDFTLNTIPNCTFSRIISAIPTSPVAGSAICDGSRPTLVVPVTSLTGKVWMDRNLGASRAAISSDDYQAYGCLYQWGRGNDGHASIIWTSSTTGTPVNGTTTTQSITDNPGNGLFVIDAGDWRSVRNDLLWQGISGVNNPCPSGYRVPTSKEFEAELIAYGMLNKATAYASPFKFVTAGYRFMNGSNYDVENGNGIYWNNDLSDTYVYVAYFLEGISVVTDLDYRANACSVRCIKD